MKQNFKLKLLFPLLFLALNLSAQVPEKAEDVSPLLIGEVLPQASLQDASGAFHDFQTLLSTEPTVLVFYRGGWCPYCNNHLAELSSIDKQIKALGYQIIAISPDNYTALANTEDKNNVEYQLLSDPKAKLMITMGLAFNSPSDKHEILPVPTLMVIDKKGEIMFEHINPSYKKRISGAYLLKVLEGLNK